VVILTVFSILDLIFESFLNEVSYLISIGLVKGYKKHSSNKTSLKGKIQFNQHLIKNLVHKEHFYTTHELYEYNIKWNRILKKALEILLTIAQDASIRNRTKKVLWNFEEINSGKITVKTFQNLRYNRKTEAYRKSIKLAELIILSYSPDIRSGKNNVLDILFDMNKLFEEYIYRVIKMEEDKYADISLLIKSQQSKLFWQGRKIRPDILLNYKKDNKTKKIIVDTKWKILTDYIPTDEDLRQMYAYNLHFGADKSILLYPKVNLVSQEPVHFEKSIYVDNIHKCQLIFADLFDENGRLIEGMGEKILSTIL